MTSGHSEEEEVIMLVIVNFRGAEERVRKVCMHETGVPTGGVEE